MTTGFTNPTNAGRVAKMCDTLALLQKSARSNKASGEEIERLLIPMLAALGDLGIVTTRPRADEDVVAYELNMAGVSPDRARELAAEIPATAPAAQGGSWGVTAPRWASVRDMAAEAPLPDLTVAMAVYLNRLDEAFSKKEV